jgi:hypothetical protein
MNFARSLVPVIRAMVISAICGLVAALVVNAVTEAIAAG